MHKMTTTLMLLLTIGAHSAALATVGGGDIMLKNKGALRCSVMSSMWSVRGSRARSVMQYFT